MTTTAPVPAPERRPNLVAALGDEVTRLPEDLAEAVSGIQGIVKQPIFMLIQRADHRWMDELGFELQDHCWMEKSDIPHGKQCAVIIDSPGGQTRVAYQLARLFVTRCGGYTAIIPRYAKSAATLFALGANRIIMGPEGEIGPLDVQVYEPDQEEYISALDEVQALHRLNSFALDAISEGVVSHMVRSGKKIHQVLPGVQRYVTDMLRPLFEKIDTVHYTKMSRLLAVAEEYAFRLLLPKYGRDESKRIAHELVHSYPEHGFVIDLAECKRIRLKIDEPSAELSARMEGVALHSAGTNIIGTVRESDE